MVRPGAGLADHRGASARALQPLREARRFGLALDVDTATFFIGRETLVPAENSELGTLRNRLYRAIAGAALSPARFYHLPTNRVVELGTQIAI